MESQFTDYPSLIYDGPFSDHIENKTSSYLEGAPEITPGEAKKRINNMTSLSLDYKGESGGNLPAYRFSGTCENGAPVSFEITKAGGMLSWYLCDRGVSFTSLSADGAKNKAREYISLLGLSNMRDTYYEIQNGIALINFAAADGDVILYPDLIKVRVALDTGEVIGSELHGYIMNHKSRNLSKSTVTLGQAKGNISELLTVKSENKALIPTEGEMEVLCYEFLCDGQNGDRVLVYINAETGEEENIYILLEDENGTLTI